METAKIPTITMEAARVNANLSQAEMAKKMNMSLKTYNDYEQGKKVLRVNQAWLFSEITAYPFHGIIFFEENYTSSVQKDSTKSA
ncbi:helix-turn-helix domain-containing protein [Enterococcus avium]|uniref:helix-turn-helix domain-containing protein n=1 Tax=Enterococcus avium TaxID=33945 RepID=UPI001F568C82|nr:helix-turn-helix transcriptional regulator [Enterococcus avium]